MHRATLGLALLLTLGLLWSPSAQGHFFKSRRPTRPVTVQPRLQTAIKGTIQRYETARSWIRTAPLRSSRDRRRNPVAHGETVLKLSTPWLRRPLDAAGVAERIRFGKKVRVTRYTARHRSRRDMRLQRRGSYKPTANPAELARQLGLAPAAPVRGRGQ